MKKINDFFDKMSTFGIIISTTIIGSMLGCFIWVIKLQTFASIINTVLLFITLVTTWRIYKEEHTYNLEIGLNIENISRKDENGISYSSVNDDKKIGVWAVNNGNASGSFHFLGIGEKLESTEYSRLEANHETPNTFDPTIHPFKTIVDGSEKRNFEKLDPGCVSTPIYFNLSNVQEYFPNAKSKIMFDVVFADPLGHFYHRTITFDRFKKTATQNE